MRLARVARLFAQNALWRSTGWRAAGRGLVRALGSDDENLRTIAGMFLAQASDKAKPLLREALSRREHLPIVLTILGDLGDHDLAPELVRFSRDEDPKVAEAARHALRVLSAH